MIQTRFNLHRYIAAALAFVVAACSPAARTTGSDNGHHVLWRIASENNVVYLLGSVHALPKDVYPLPAPIERAYDSAQVVVFELPMDDVGMASMQSTLLTRGFLKGSRTLKDILSDSTYAMASAAMQKLGLDIQLFNKMKPWVIAIMMMGLEMQNSGIQAELGIDMHFQKKASTDGREIMGLESLDDQIKIFDEMSFDAQEDFLRQQLSGGEKSVDGLREIIAAWQRGDLQALEASLSGDMLSDSAVAEAMVYQRNRNWVPQIEKYLRDGKRNYLVVVGALHLVGEQGVVALLRRKGYIVDQI